MSSFQMDFLFFREQERVHLVIRSWAEIAASGSLAPHLMCPLSHAAPVSRRLQHSVPTNGNHQEAACSAEASGGGGGHCCLSSSLRFLSGHLALLTVISLLFFFKGSSQLVHICANVHKPLHMCVCVFVRARACVRVHVLHSLSHWPAWTTPLPTCLDSWPGRGQRAEC